MHPSSVRSTSPASDGMFEKKEQLHRGGNDKQIVSGEWGGWHGSFLIGPILLAVGSTRLLSCFPVLLFSLLSSPLLSRPPLHSASSLLPHPFLRSHSPPSLLFPFHSHPSPLQKVQPTQAICHLHPRQAPASPTLRLTLTVCQLQMPLTASCSTATISAVVWHAVKAACILCNNRVTSAHNARMRATLRL